MEKLNWSIFFIIPYFFQNWCNSVPGIMSSWSIFFQNYGLILTLALEHWEVSKSILDFISPVFFCYWHFFFCLVFAVHTKEIFYQLILYEARISKVFWLFKWPISSFVTYTAIFRQYGYFIFSKYGFCPSSVHEFQPIPYGDPNLVWTLNDTFSLTVNSKL